MAVSQPPTARRKLAPKYRIGRVTIHLRGETWHVYYFEMASESAGRSDRT